MILALAAAVTMKSTVTVFAAASLKDAFTQLAQTFEKSNPTVQVRLSFAGSQTLAAQIAHGAPADVFASASRKNLLDAKPNPKTIKTFARNRLALVFKKGSLAKNPRDLSQATRLVIADDKVPAGAYALQFLYKAEMEYGPRWFKQTVDHISSRELDVRAVLAKVKLGEADAGIVYYSDWFASKKDLVLVGIPERLNVFADYPIALNATPRNPDGGRAFLNFTLSKPGQDILAANGFMRAPTKR